MKETLIDMLLHSEEEFVSGEKISKYLGCTRTAVWKHIEELRKNGYEVEAVPRKGYRLVKSPNSITSHEIKAQLKTKTMGKSITYYESTTSTNEVALRLAQEGAEEGHIVIADEQTSGKGRLGRVWLSPLGTSVLMTVILRPKIPPQRAPQLTLLVAVGVVRGIEKTTDLRCEIKWPSDVLLNGKKLVGILTEMQSEPDYIHAIIVGVGINVNHKKEYFSSEIRNIATSLAIEKGQEVHRATLVANILYELECLYEQYLREGFAPIKELWESYAINMGKEITARTVRGTIKGVAKGITDDGVLLLEDGNGTIHSIYSADIDIN